jgi:hypothetical protein
MSVGHFIIEVSKEMRNEMNEILNAKLALDLAKSNLEILIAKGWDTDEDYDQVYWLECEFNRLNKKGN